MKFTTVEKEIKPILKDNNLTRADDMLLYAEYLKLKGGNMNKAFLDRKYRLINGLASYETVSRVRRKLQEVNPKLKPSKSYLSSRKAAEKEYKQYAKGVKK